MSIPLFLTLATLRTPATAVQTVDPAPPTITVFAAASLADAFGELGRLFEAAHPGTTVQFNFAGSQQLVAQLEQGAAADVLAAADTRSMSRATEAGLVAGEPAIFAGNRLVLIVPRANPARIGRLQDLARSGTKLVMAAEVVPAGKYGRDVLKRLTGAPGFPPEYDRRVLANVVSQEENVKGVVAKVQLGEADAGLVYQSDVTPAVARPVRAFEIADPYNVMARYPIAVLKGARNPEAARQFVDLVSSDEGQRILGRHGFLPAAASAPGSPSP
jgi:molybdate transport system substrate-binding protein